MTRLAVQAHVSYDDSFVVVYIPPLAVQEVDW